MFSGSVKCDCTNTGYVGATCGIYFPYGPQTNVNEEKLSLGGWKVCHYESMDVQQSSASIDNVLSKCWKSKLIMGCRMYDSSKIDLLAAAPNAKEALKVTRGNGQIINGSKWYRRRGHSYGFAHESSKIIKSISNYADKGTGMAELRLSYNLNIGNTGGYRCGTGVWWKNDRVARHMRRFEIM